MKMEEKQEYRFGQNSRRWRHKGVLRDGNPWKKEIAISILDSHFKQEEQVYNFAE